MTRVLGIFEGFRNAYFGVGIWDSNLLKVLLGFLSISIHPKFETISKKECESEKKQSGVNRSRFSLSLCFVESEGFEPSSKRRVFKLSTCLFLDWFSIAGRTRTPKPTT